MRYLTIGLGLVYTIVHIYHRLDQKGGEGGCNCMGIGMGMSLSTVQVWKVSFRDRVPRRVPDEKSG